MTPREAIRASGDSMNAAPSPDVSRARAFLTKLDPEAQSFTLQTFDDTKAKRKAAARIHHVDPANGALDVLSGWNNAGAGVFVTVNETDGRGRQTDNVRRVRAVFADLDGAPLEPVLSAPLEPHIVVESSPGRYHAYWLCDDCPLDKFEAVQRALAARFGSDPSVHDLPRVMRLPGFLHCKGEPFLTRELEGVGFNGPPYALAEIVATLGLDLSPQATARSTGPTGGRIEPGGRHAHLFALGRSMAYRKASRDAVRSALAAENRDRCDPPLDDAEIDDLAGRAFNAKDSAAWAAHRDAEAVERAGGDASATGGTDAHADTHDAPAGDSGAWPAPHPLSAKVEPEGYPLDALPDTIRAAVEEVAGFVKAPLPLVTGSALGALSLACQGYVDVQRADKLHGPTGLFLLTIADSGERKSTCDGFFTKAIRDYQDEQAEFAKPVLKEHAAAFAAWNAEREGLLSAVKSAGKAGKPTDKLRGALAALEKRKPEAPRIPRLLLGDETPENLAWGLAKQWPTAGVLSSEAGIVLGSHGMGRDSVMRNLALLNVLWDGGTHSVGRRTSESFTVRGARLTVGLQVQEATLREFFARSGPLARGTGFLARFLVAWPQSTQGNRPFTEAPAHWPHLAAFHRRMAAILNQPVPIDDDGALTPAMLTFTPGAKAAWVAFHDEIEAGLRSGGELYDVRDVASKTADNAARLAALFQVFEHGAGAVGADCFERASRIAAWHLWESRRFFGELALPAELADAARLDGWLIEYCRRERTHFVSTREAQRLGPIRDKERLAIALRELDDLDRVRVDQERRRRTIKVNPALVGIAA